MAARLGPGAGRPRVPNGTADTAATAIVNVQDRVHRFTEPGRCHPGAAQLQPTRSAGEGHIRRDSERRAAAGERDVPGDEEHLQA